MSPEQIERIRGTVAALEPHGEELAGAFYERMVEMAPATMAQWPEGPSARALMDWLSTFVALAPDFPALAAWVTQLHGAAPWLNARATRAVGQALIDAVVLTLGDDLEAEDVHAWRAGVTLVAELREEPGTRPS